jgi:Co/Zn/Cd efflux system component
MLPRPPLLRHQGHDHGPGDARASGSTDSTPRLLGCFVLTAAFMVVEARAGLWTNTHALLADAIHRL